MVTEVEKQTGCFKMRAVLEITALPLFIRIRKVLIPEVARKHHPSQARILLLVRLYINHPRKDSLPNVIGFGIEAPSAELAQEWRQVLLFAMLECACFRNAVFSCHCVTL